MIVGQILCERVEAEPIPQSDAPTQIELRVTMVKVAIGQQQTVAPVDIESAEKIRIIRPARKGGVEQERQPAMRVARRKESRVRRPSEWPCSLPGANPGPTGMPL